MSFTARASEPRWPVEDGRTRTTIAGYVVDWTGAVPPTEAEVLATVTPPTNTQVNLSQRQEAKDLINSPGGDGKSRRVIVSMTINQFNIIRDWLMDFKTAVAQASTLAQLKSAVALLPNLLEIGLTDAKTQYINRVDDGTVDVDLS